MSSSLKVSEASQAKLGTSIFELKPSRIFLSIAFLALSFFSARLGLINNIYLHYLTTVIKEKLECYLLIRFEG